MPAARVWATAAEVEPSAVLSAHWLAELLRVPKKISLSETVKVKEAGTVAVATTVSSVTVVITMVPVSLVPIVPVITRLREAAVVALVILSAPEDPCKACVPISIHISPPAETAVEPLVKVITVPLVLTTPMVVPEGEAASVISVSPVTQTLSVVLSKLRSMSS